MNFHKTYYKFLNAQKVQIFNIFNGHFCLAAVRPNVWYTIEREYVFAILHLFSSPDVCLGTRILFLSKIQ